MPTVIAADDAMIDAGALREALPADATVAVRPLPDAAAVRAAAGEAAALVVDVNTPVPAEAMAGLSVVARAGVGLDGVDLAAAAAEGVTVLHVPEYGTGEVATHAVALLLSCCRHVCGYDRAVAGGRWDWTDGRPLRRLAGHTVGLVSFGPIARATADRLAGFGCDLAAYDPYVGADEMADRGVEKLSVEELGGVDHLSVHAPLTEETRGLVGADLLAALPDHAVVVNTGRGGVVDEAALLDALEDGEIRAAGLDVLAAEPPGDNPLVGREDVVLTPHAGWYSEEARDDLNRTLAADLRRALAGEAPENAIDPEEPPYSG
ncbi:MAG: C-terminal binding protein [Halobacteriaceae archaeon]